MIAVDTNVLVYAHRGDAPLHKVALEKVQALADSGQRWGIPWPCIHEFLAVVTHPRIYRPPTPLDLALDALAAWMESPTLTLLAEGPGHFERLSILARSGHVQGGRIHDARIAAICIESGVRQFWTVDRDFSRFPSLRAVNPLQASSRG